MMATTRRLRVCAAPEDVCFNAKRLIAEPEEELGLAKIGKHLGVSHERARQLEARAKRKLRIHIEQLERASGYEFAELSSAA
jgi:DNA-directed RNA polymerase sigma subunit (sigma70/sigma32)